MKKTISLILAVVMLLTGCFAVLSFAAEGDVDPEPIVCNCASCTKTPNGCHCCAACPYLDETYLLSCAKNEQGHFKGSFCCGKCSGIWPCACDCECCKNKDDTPDAPSGPIIPEKERKNIINGFQSIIKQVAGIFYQLFDSLFAFLRIGEVFPELIDSLNN